MLLTETKNKRLVITCQPQILQKYAKSYHCRDFHFLKGMNEIKSNGFKPLINKINSIHCAGTYSIGHS